MTYFIGGFRVDFSRVIIFLNILNQVISVIQIQYVLCDVRNLITLKQPCRLKVELKMNQLQRVLKMSPFS
jgi:hypothetical protein